MITELTNTIYQFLVNPIVLGVLFILSIFYISYILTMMINLYRTHKSKVFKTKSIKDYLKTYDGIFDIIALFAFLFFSGYIGFFVYLFFTLHNFMTFNVENIEKQIDNE